MSPNDSNLTPPSGWTEQGIAIERKFEFNDFTEAMIFVNRVAEAADEANHHPDISISYNKVTLQLTSHDTGRLTSRDIKMANTINQLLEQPRQVA